MDRESYVRWIREVVARNRPLLLAEANKLCRNSTDADDLVQETLLRFVQSADVQRGPSDERGCVCLMVRILSNRFCDMYRRGRVRDRHADEVRSQGNELTDPYDIEAPPLFESVTDEQLSQAMQSLSPKLRETFDLLISGKKYREIADAQDISVGTVSKRIFDARARLREFLLKLLNRE
ncbi:RNA polymerase sigma factor [Pyxidicoccus parkwayensis]|uniref:RNA polymerase sigma factor n=1 Tax=Pyxidicoccus parkwayensis TaxID=2813578 RepID=A0ABX7NR26_9BACT|nr:RNA polymerase sigma factor [Pyxidicoccus parkwaysis]QSQ19909.1 RNA polymerase sigma factor [Pyxidicoccus parkwaysis]